MYLLFTFWSFKLSSIFLEEFVLGLVLEPVLSLSIEFLLEFWVVEDLFDFFWRVVATVYYCSNFVLVEFRDEPLFLTDDAVLGFLEMPLVPAPNLLGKC